MTVFVAKLNDSIMIFARAETARGLIGDLTFEVKPGESALGKSYTEWEALGAGQHTVE
jgi:hypothetical protein